MPGSVAAADPLLTGRVIASGITPGAGESTGVPRGLDTIGDELVRGEGDLRILSEYPLTASMKPKSRNARL